MTEPHPGQPGNPGSNPQGMPAYPGSQGGFDPTATYGGAPGVPSGQQQLPPQGPPPGWGAPAPGQPYPGQTGAYQQPVYAPAKPSFFALLPAPYKLTLGSALAGIITFFMGFLGWISLDASLEQDLEKWALDSGDSLSIPAFFSPSLILSPGWFLVALGAVALASLGLVAPKWRRFLPHLVFFATAAWLGLFASAMGLPSFISLGAGAYVALIFGALQAALLGAAAIIEGLGEAKPGGQP